MAAEPLPKERALNIEVVVFLGMLLFSWQIASLWLPEYVAPGLQLIAAEFIKMAGDETLFRDTFLTLYRILQGLIDGFIVGGFLGVLMGSMRTAERYGIRIIEAIETDEPTEKR